MNGALAKLEPPDERLAEWIHHLGERVEALERRPIGPSQDDWVWLRDRVIRLEDRHNALAKRLRALVSKSVKPKKRRRT